MRELTDVLLFSNAYGVLEMHSFGRAFAIVPVREPNALNGKGTMKALTMYLKWHSNRKIILLTMRGTTQLGENSWIMSSVNLMEGITLMMS